MGRSGSVGFAVLIPVFMFLVAGATGCGSQAVTTASNAVPASIRLTPSPSASMELGTYQAFTATPVDSANRAVTTEISFQSSNTAVVTVAVNGMVCAGAWDSLTNPQICTPGPVGVAQVSATAQGVSSPPTAVYVHQHIDKMVLADICAVAGPPTPCTLPRNVCQSLNQNSAPQNTVYEARAYSGGTDITSTAGQFNWQAANSSVVTLSNTAAGLSNMVNSVSLNQVEGTATTPGVSPVFATIGTATSVPVNFTTCPVQAISLTVTNATKTSETIVPTVTDTAGNVIMSQGSKTSVPLTWSSSEPASVTVTSSGAATGSATGGGAAIIASCTPPTCNVGFLPTQPIYPEKVVTLTVAGTGNPQNSTTYISSTGCGTADGCVSTVVAVTAPANTLGNTFILPATPNSLVFNRQGTKAYLGTNSGLLGSKGLMVFDPSAGSITQFTSMPGNVLAVSPDGSKIIVSDTTDTPNQVYIFDTTTNGRAIFSITGATAADFSPDSLKAHILADNGNTLYVYSKLEALRKIPLSAPANDVTFLSEGAFAYLAGGVPNAVTVWRTCDNFGPADTIGTPATPAFIKTLPDAAHVLALDPPGIDIISVNTTPTGCAPSVSDSVSSFNLGQGNFTAKQLIISEDGSTAYVVASSLASILTFNISAETTAALPLFGNANPIRATLTPDGTLLYVAASDGTVHVVNTVAGGDIQQISFPLNLCQNSAGQPWSTPCKPDLVAVQP